MQTALRAIATPTYHYDVEANAVSIDPNDHIEVLTGQKAWDPFFVIEVPPDREIEYFPAEQLLELVPIDITAAADADVLDPVSRLRTFQRLCQDVETALTVDVTRGGLVSDQRIVNKRMGMMVGEARVIAVIETVARLHRTYGAPAG